MSQKSIDKLIINDAYTEPTRYWAYIRESQEFELREGRRKAGYWKLSGVGHNGNDDLGEFVELELVNKIRSRVQKWRAENYPNITGTTICIGSVINVVSNIFPGDVDEVKIYNRALSENEITNLYNSTKVNYIQSIPRNGLVGYWTMNSDDINGTTVYDKSGNGNNGAGTNITSLDLVTGKVKETLDFNGSNEYINVSDSTILKPTLITETAWIKLGSNVIGSGVAAVAVKEDSNSGYGINILGSNYANGINNGLEFFIGNGSGIYDALASTSLDLDVWYHVAGVFDGSQVHLYINGNLADSSNAVVSISHNTRVFSIGGRSSFSDRFFNGLVDEVRIYNRALSADEVMQHYLQTRRNLKL